MYESSREFGTLVVRLSIVLISKASSSFHKWLTQDSSSQVDDYNQNDDVFRTEFLANVIFIGLCPSAVILEDEARGLLKGWESSFTIASLDQFSSPPPPPGPYVRRGNLLWQVRRLYDDANQTFLTACQPAHDGTS